MTPFITNTETSCEHFAGIDESKVFPRTPECVKFIKKSILKCKFSFLGCLAILFIETYFDFLIF